MSSPSDSSAPHDVNDLRNRLQNLRHSVDELDALLDRYITAEEELRQSEERFRLLVREVREYAIFMLDIHGYIASWNAGAQLIKGYTAQEIIGRHFSIFYPSEAVAVHRPQRALEIAIADGVYKEEGWRVRKDGTRFWASVVITALHDDSGDLRGFGKVTRDLTERKQAEEAQRQLQEQQLQLTREESARAQAEANMRLRDGFLNATAHELRTPVTAVLGYAQLLRRRLDRPEVTFEQVRQPVQAIAEQAKRLDRLTTMLLDITRLEHGRFALERRTMNLCATIELVVHEFRRLSERHTITVELPDTPLFVAGDELRLEQVLYNLLQNAVKYSPVGGTIAVSAGREEQYAVITVRDQGVGIPAEELPHIFERFYRATNIPEGSISGLGLGLYLVRALIEMHGGTVDVRSVVGEGTTFRVRLPLISTSDDGDSPTG
jgi:PAS domain S-box-containing protein